MDLHTLKNNKGAKRRHLRVGRGRSSGMGKTSSRGSKGQKARSGYSRKLTFEGGQMPLVRRVPKRGFTHVKQKILLPVNIGALSRFEDGAEVNVETLRGAGLASGYLDGIKILGGGELSKKLTVKASAFSGSARSKIEKAGGRCEVVA